MYVSLIINQKVSHIFYMQHRTQPSPVVYYPLLGVAKLFPGMRYYTGIDFEYLSHDKDRVEYVRHEPLFHATCTLAQMRDMLDR